MKTVLNSIYHKLYSYFGEQHWWPAETPLEVAIGAILTQNTNWQNVEKAIGNIKKAKRMDFAKLNRLSQSRLARLIRPSGYYNIKAARLREFLKFLENSCQGDMSYLRRKNSQVLRQELLAVKGIGPETADSILLYALNKPFFVIDAYTKRMLIRHKLIGDKATYIEMQNLFMQNLQTKVKLFNEFHALIVRLAKSYCTAKNPRCGQCPLKSLEN